MEIRPAIDTDADQAVELARLVEPYRVETPDTFRAVIERAATDDRHAVRVVVSGRDLVAWLNVGTSPLRREPGLFGLRMMVHPDHRRQGVATALVEQVRDHLARQDVRLLETVASDSGVAFAIRHGGVPGDVIRYASVELGSLRERPIPPDGVRVVPLAELDPQDVYLVYAEVAAQIPGQAHYEVSYEWFRSAVWEAANFDHALGAAAVVDGRLVALTVVARGGTSIWSDMTGTLAPYRGRGLAKLVKSASLRWAAEAGCRGAYTLNLDHNAPMVAVNTWLGYQETARSTVMTWTADSAADRP